MSHTHCQPTSADPARHEPSEVRPANCTCCGGAREPDPTDDYMRMLRRLAEIGMARAEQIHTQMQATAEARRADPAAAPDADDPDLSKADLTLQRVARMVRLCMALSLKFHSDRLGREKQNAADYAVAEKKRRQRRKSQIERVIRQVNEREAAEGREAFDFDELDSDVSERLEEEDIERDLDRCSIGELVGRVFREYGIEPDWDFLRQHHWALEEAQFKPPGSPYATPPEPEAEAAKPPEPEEPKPPEVETGSPDGASAPRFRPEASADTGSEARDGSASEAPPRWSIV